MMGTIFSVTFELVFRVNSTRRPFLGRTFALASLAAMI
jgi:hypothetical protein